MSVYSIAFRNFQDKLYDLWKGQDKYIDHLEQRLAKEGEEKGKNVETSRREQLLVMRLTAKDQEMQEMAAQIAELKSAQAPSTAMLRQVMANRS